MNKRIRQYIGLFSAVLMYYIIEQYPWMKQNNSGV